MYEPSIMFLNYGNACWLAKVSHPVSEAAFDLNHFGEQTLTEVALLLKTIIEGVALLFLFWSIIRVSFKILAGGDRLNGKRMSRNNILLLARIDLGSALSLALEFLLAADIAATAVAPSWDKLGQLGAISIIRTLLNYFLQRENKELEHTKQSNLRTMDTELLSD